MILSNQIECLKCGDKPFSAATHDYKECKCGAVAVDGGMSYIRRTGDPLDYKELSISMNDQAIEAAKKALQWCTINGRNNLGRICHIAIALRDNGVKLVEVNSETTTVSD